MKGKIAVSNKKIRTFGIIFVLCTILLGTLAYKTNVFTSKTNNPITNENAGPSTNPNWDPTGMGISPEDIVIASIDLANHNDRTHPSGCIGFVNNVISNASSGNCSLIDGCSGWDSSKIRDISVNNAKYKYTNTQMNGITWWNALGMNSNTLKPGDIIIGDGHAMIYLGQASSYSDLNNKLQASYGRSFTTTVGSNSTTSTYYREYPLNWSVGDTYWVVDVNGNGGTARISNYNWTDTSESAGSWNLNNMRLFRFKKETPGSYTLKVGKVGSDNLSKYIKGATFRVEKLYNGAEPKVVENYTTVDNDYTVIESGRTINSTGYDDYKINEISAPSGYDGNSKQLGFQVVKELVNGNYRVKHVYYYSGGGATYKEKTIAKDSTAYIFSDGTAKILGSAELPRSDNAQKAKAIAAIAVSADGTTISYTGIDQKLTGDYHLNIVKKDINDQNDSHAINKDSPEGKYTQALGGAEYEVKQYINRGIEGTPTATGKTEGDNTVVSKAGEHINILFNGSAKVNITQVGDVYDTYTVRETKAPTGYKIYNNTWTFGFKVYKKKEGTKYVIDRIEMVAPTSGTSKTAPAVGSSTWLRFDKNLNVISDSSPNKDDYVFALEFNQNAITISYKNEPISGKYNMSISKKSTDEEDGDELLPGAEYIINQYRDKAFDQPESAHAYTQNGDGKRAVKSSSARKQALYFDDINDDEIPINNVGFDAYQIKETKAPAGYGLNNDWNLGFKVYKGYDNDSTPTKYVIKKLEITSAISADGTNVTVSGNEHKWIKIKANGSATTNANDEDYIIGFEVSIDSIDITYKNPKITGDYSMNIKKINQSNDDSPVQGVRFKINNSYTNPTNSDGITNVVDSKVIDKDSLSDDSYEITEVDLGDNAGLVKLREGITVIVHKGQVGTKYAATSANFKYASGEESETAENNNGPIKQKAVLEDGSEVDLELEVKDGSIDVTIPNRSVGKYNLFIGKKSTSTYLGKNNGETVSDDDYISGARFEVLQYLDCNIEKPASSAFKKSAYPYSKNGEATAIEYDNSADIPITSTEYDDYYKITEIEWPSGYVENRTNYYLKVSKTINPTTKAYEIKTVDVLEDNEVSSKLQSMVYMGTLVDDPNCESHTVAWGAISTYTNKQFRVELNKETNTITFVVADKPIGGSYNFQLIKKDATGNTIKNESAIFDVTAYEYISASHGQTHLSGVVDLYNEQGQKIETTGLRTTSGIASQLKSIKIKPEDIGKTYYFRIHEASAPASYNGINYDVVVPVSFAQKNSGYVMEVDSTQAFGLTSNDARKELSELKDGTNGVIVTKADGVTVDVQIPNKPKAGKYNFTITKTDVSGKIIKDEHTKFDISVFDNRNARGTELQIRNDSGVINTKNLTATTGVVESVSGIIIDGEDINKTFYYRIKETQAPDEYTAINYDVVVPITFREVNGEYVALKGDAYAIVGEGANEQTKSLNEVATETTGIVTTNQTDVTINVNVPNKHKSGTYNFVVTKNDISGKVIENEHTRFDISVYDNQNLAGDEIQIANKDGDISTKNISVPTGILEGFEGIIINAGDIGKTYYFVVTETQAPDDFTKIDYEVVIPISYSDVDGEYKVTKGEAYAVRRNAQGQITETKSLQEVATSTNDVVTTDQVDATISVKVPNKHKEGNFNFNLNKYIKGTTTPLDDAKFTVAIRNVNKNEYVKSGSTVLDGSVPYTTANGGKINIPHIDIEKEGITYEITIHEAEAPTGYLPISGDIVFNATSQLKGNEYVLIPATPAVTNAKKVEIKEGEILVEGEDIPEPVIHKGVDDIKNQDSGYYDNVEHRWIINTTVPSGIKDFTKYVVTDTIHENLDFAGVNKVKVKVKGGRDLVADKDYKVKYETGAKLVTITFIDDNFTAGRNLPENSTIEITLKTTFAKDPATGMIKALDTSVPNTSKLLFSNGSGVITKVSETPEVHTGGIKVFKYVSESGQNVGVPGAVFKLAKTEADARNGRYLKVKDAEGNDTSEDITGTSDANGVVKFFGLEFGRRADANAQNATTDTTTGADVYAYDYEEVSSDYWVVETNAPEGYTLNTNPVFVTIRKDSYDINIEAMPSIAEEEITGQYSINLLKTNKSNNNPIANAKFAITSVGNHEIESLNSPRTTGSDGKLDITNGTVKIVSNTKNPSGRESKVGVVDAFEIQELENEGYLLLKNPLKINIYKTEENENYKVSKIILSEKNTSNSATLTVTNVNRTVTLRNVQLTGYNKKVDVTLSIDNNNAISIVVPNEELEGKFKILLEKTDSTTGNKLAGIPFEINGAAKQTSSTGIISVTEDDDVDGFVKITNASLTPSTYVIEEKENSNTEDYSIIANPITLKLNKGKNSTETEYMVTSIDVTYTSSTGENTDTINIDPLTKTGSGRFYVKTKYAEEDILATISINGTGEIVLKVGNPGKTGGYELGLSKALIDSTGNMEMLAGTKFMVYDRTNPQSITTTELVTKDQGTHSAKGYTDSIHKDITKENVNNTDTFVVKEVSTREDYVAKLKYNIKIDVTKGLNDEQDAYVLKTIKLSEIDDSGRIIQESETLDAENPPVYLRNVTLENGDKVDILLNCIRSQKLELHVRNKEYTGEFKIKIRKINSVTNQGVNGIPFGSSGRNVIEDSTVTAHVGDEDGIGEFDTVTITRQGTYFYNIMEGQLPAELQGNMLRISDFYFNVKISTKLNTTTKAYELDKVEMNPVQAFTSDTTEVQRRIVNDATLDVDGNIITLTIKNEPTVNYDLKIRKINTDDEAIKDAKFTVYEDDGAIIENKSINDLINEGVIESSQDYYLIRRTGMTIGTTHKYKIYEMSPALGYDNILEKAYIVTNVKINNDGTATATSPAYLPRFDKGGTSLDAIATGQKVGRYLREIGKEEIVDEGNNSFMLTIPNPRTEIPMDLKLLKHTTASENNGVTGAVFTTKKLVVANEQTPTDAEVIIARLNVAGDNLARITTDAHNLINDVDAVDKAIVGNSYYYMLTESEIPDGFQGFYQKAVIRIHANTDRTVSASLIAAMPFGSTTWITDPSTITADYLSVDNPEGNTVQVKWANRFEFEVELWKKAYTGSVPKDANGNTNWSGMQPISGAHFTVKQVEGNTETYVHNVSNQEMNDLECDMIEVMRDNNATTEKTYHYTFEENSSRPNYINIFDGVKVHLYVTTTADGKIDSSSNKTYYILEGASAEKARFLSDKIGLNIEDHRVEIYIANQEKTLDVNIKKVSTNTASGTAVPVSDVTFGALKDRAVSLTATTDENGMANIDTNISRGGTHLYQITETVAPDGINKLEQVEIDLTLDLSDLESIDDITLDRASLSISATGATGRRIIDELNLEDTIKLSLEDSTFVITVPNVTKVYSFVMFKTDEGGVPINNSDNNGATSFQVQRVIRKTATGEFVSRTVLNNGELSSGRLLDYGTALPNHTYEYEIKEIRPKDGYINVLQGYELHVIAKTDANGLIYPGGNPEYTLVETGTEPTLYTENELRTGDYINLSADSNNVSLYIMNPYDYKFKLSKADKNGAYAVNQAVINAQKIGNAHIKELHVASNNYDDETIKTLLKEIVDSDSVEKTINLRNASTVTSDLMEIRKNDGSMMPQNGIAQLWRITEDSVAAPYENVLEGKYVIVPTMYRGGQLNTVEHPIGIDDSVVNVDFYVCDAEGNDLTADYINVIDVDAVKNAGDTEWTLAVTIKDPISIKLKFNKVEMAAENASEASDFTALSGATLEIADSTSGRSYSISNGASSTELIDLKVGMGNTEIFTIRETASAPGHINIFENKQIMVAVRTLPDNPTEVTVGMVDLTSGRTISGPEFNRLLRYINIVQSEDENGYPVVNVCLENPIEMKFKLDKVGPNGEPLTDTEIQVISSHSGEHRIGGRSSMEFVEDNLQPGSVITYRIKELHSVENTAIINKFNSTMYIITRVGENGVPMVVQAYTPVPNGQGGVDLVPLRQIEGIDYGITTGSDGISTLHLTLENPIDIDIELFKSRTDGHDGFTSGGLNGVNFTIVSSNSGEHTNTTNSRGLIGFTEERITPGTYTYVIKENSTQNRMFINILKDKYIKVTINVSNEGAITIEDTKYYNDDNDNNYNNDTEITNAQLLSQLRKYTNIEVVVGDDYKNKLAIKVENPFRLPLTIYKSGTDEEVVNNKPIKDVQFKAKITDMYTNESHEYTETTDSQGKIHVNDNELDSMTWTNAGIHKFEITELSIPGINYDNILEGHKMEFYVHILASGMLKYCDENGNDIPWGTNPNFNDFYEIKKLDDSDPDYQVNELIHKYIRLSNTIIPGITDDGISVYVQNTTGYIMDIVKKNTAENELTGTTFSVVRNGNVSLLDNGLVTNDAEIAERNLPEGDYTFEITENSTVENSSYVNILDGRFIKVYTHLNSDGVVNITDANGNNNATYFEVYNGNINYQSSATKATDEYLYELVSVSAHDDNHDGVYTIEVTVKNPIDIKVQLLKSQYGNGATGIPGTKFTITRNDGVKHEDVLTNSDGLIEFTEEKILPGDYTYKVEEKQPAGYQYVNILENKYYEVGVTVTESGAIIITSAKICNSDGTEVDNSVYSKINKYVGASVDSRVRPQRLDITIYDPVRIKADIYKKDIAGNSLSNVRMVAKRYLVSNSNAQIDVNKMTDNNGYINIEDGYVDPGLYKYVVTETATAGNQYINVLENTNAVVYVKVSLDGTLQIVDKNGNPFGAGVEHNYYLETSNGGVVNEETQRIIYSNLTFTIRPVTNSNGVIEATLINPIKYEIDIDKFNERGASFGNANDGYAKFTVIRDDGTKIIDNMNITEPIEHIEKYMEKGEHTYYITENSTLPGYINKLKNKFIKASINVAENGVVTVNGYDIYEGDINNVNSGRLIERSANQDLYSLVDVSAHDNNNDGVYTLEIKVTNPDIKYNFVLNKKIFGDEHINLSNTKFDVISGFSGRHSNIVTDVNGNISFKEERVPAGTYRYLVTETRAPGNQFINVLRNDDHTNTYIEVMLKVNEDGTIEIVDEDGNSGAEQYYIYKQESQGSNTLNPVDLNDTVVDEFVKVNTSVVNKVPQLNIFIKDPEQYNLGVVKVDKRRNRNMNNVDFTFNVYDQNGQRVEFRSAKTLERLIEGQVTTQTVNGVDGVISIENILIEKAGKYTFAFHEESTEGKFDRLYKSWAEDVRIEIEIVVENGEYVVKDPSIKTGIQYVGDVNISTSRAQIVGLQLDNAPIEGKYNLYIAKLDSYTDRTLAGAEFDISVSKNDEEYELYEDNGDLDSFNVIIPTHVTINGDLMIRNIRIDRPETYTITLTETKAPTGYMLLDEPIKIKVTTGRAGEYDDEKFIVESVELLGTNHDLVSMDYDDKSISVIAKNEYFDLALRKSITSVAYPDKEEAKITEEETEDRIPEVVADDLLANNTTTANYNHVKNHVRGYVGQDIIYTLRVYNEGEIDGYAEEITDHLPEGLEFVNDDFNAERGWRLDESDESLRTVKTTYLSENDNPNNERFNKTNNLIKKLDIKTGVVDYKEIEIKCRIKQGVKAKTILTNIAEISISKAADRTAETIDRDSRTVPGAEIPDTNEGMQAYKETELTDDRNTYVPGQEDDDDFEKVIVEEFDLALRKYIVAVDDEELLNTSDDDAKYDREPRVNVSTLKDGTDTTAEYTHTKEPVEVSTDDIVTYTLEVFNEGTVSGYAKLIKDDIPEGLEFVTYEAGDGSTNDMYRWKMVDENDNEVTDPADAKYVISDYLSKENELEDGEHLIQAFDPETMDKPDSKYVRVQFRVVCKQNYPKIIKNEAQISDDSDEKGKSVIDRDSTPNEWLEEDDEDVEYVRVTFMDLALRKFITGVTDGASGKTKEVLTRIPQVDAKELIEETGTTAKYEHTKEPVLVHTSDTVIYTLRVYNEGSRDGYATQIKDDLPEGLEFLPNHEINKEYEWTLVDGNDKPVTDIKKAKYAVTNYLSKDNETNERQSLMKAFDKETMTVPEYKDVKIAFKVVEPTTSDRILTNEAQISKQTDGKGKVREDRDSTPNEWLGEDDEDVEHVKVLCFDLALRKWVTKAIVTEKGETKVVQTGHHAEDDPEEVVKVDLKKSKVDSVVVKFEYQIRITNEGEIAGYADEVKDYIPEGLKFEQVDNPTWVQLSENIVVTDELKGTLLKPGESAEVTIVLTWINSETNMGVKTNIAEISKDRNDYGTKDIDSTPNNKVPGEDDIDDAPVMLSIKTGSETTKYAVTILAVLAILGLGISVIKESKKEK